MKFIIISVEHREFFISHLYLSFMFLAMMTKLEFRKKSLKSEHKNDRAIRQWKCDDSLWDSAWMWQTDRQTDR